MTQNKEEALITVLKQDLLDANFRSCLITGNIDRAHPPLNVFTSLGYVSTVILL